MRLRVHALIITTGLVMSGCATMASHDDVANQVERSRISGGIPGAIQQLDLTAKSPQQKAELLYNLERGQLLRLNGDIEASSTNLNQADAVVRQWEEMAKTNPSKLLGLAGASLVSERLSTYEGHDYEKVWLTTLLALNRISANDLDGARVEIKRTHEREAVIKDLRAKSVAAAEADAKKAGAQAQTKEINGYPVDTINSPEVLQLKNGYQNALSHYLAGFVYELNGEASLAAAGYRQAIELRPGSSILEEGLRGLDGRTSPAAQRGAQSADVLLIVETGSAPARVSRDFTVPIVLPNGLRTVSLSYPVIEPSRDAPLSEVQINGAAARIDQIVDLNTMARRELRDEMPGLVARNISRAVVKGVAQNELEKQAGLFGSIVGAVASAMTEKADDRMWRTLPGHVYVGRVKLPPGEHRLTVAGRDAGTITVGSRYAIVPIRVMDDSVIRMPVSQFGTLAPPAGAVTGVGSAPQAASAR